MCVLQTRKSMYDLEKLLDSGSLSGLTTVDEYINEYNDYNSSGPKVNA